MPFVTRNLKTERNQGILSTLMAPVRGNVSPSAPPVVHGDDPSEAVPELPVSLPVKDKQLICLVVFVQS